MLTNKTLIIAGKNDIAVLIAEFVLQNYSDFNVLAVFNQNDSGIDCWQRSFKKYCKDQDVKSIELEECYKLENSIFLSLEFDKIVKPKLFKTDSLFNIHFSLLPKYKGMYTSVLPLLHGEKTSGVTLHEIEMGIDTGNIINQKEFPISELQNSFQLYQECVKEGVALITENFSYLIKNNFKSRIQPSIGSTYFSKMTINYSLLKLIFNCTAWEVLNQIKAFTFRPYQLININGEEISFAKITDQKSSVKPGVLVFEDDDRLTYSTIDFNIELIKDRLNELLNACKHGYSDVINKILQTNPTLINEKNKNGWNSIIIASFFGHKNIIETLISKGADINSININGTTVFMYAKDYCIKKQNIELLEFLLLKGADYLLEDFNNKTVLDYVEVDRNCVVSTFLKEL
jgi:methionyl-tRNA formyltransferase